MATHDDAQTRRETLDIRFIPALFSSRREGKRIEMLVLHYTAGPTLTHCVELFRNPNHPASCHYIVGTDGQIVQMVYDHDCAWHCGVSRWRHYERCNPWSLGIEIVNWGRLEQKNGMFYCWPEHYTTRYEGLPPVFAEGDWWAPYPAEQVERVLALSRYLAQRYGIRPDHIVAHSDIAPGRKIDPGPAFPWAWFREQMQS